MTVSIRLLADYLKKWRLTKLSTKLELETFAGKSFQAWKDQAAKAGLVLRAPDGIDSGDYPNSIYSSLRLFRRNIAITKDHKKIVTHIFRQLVNTRDDNGRPTKKEYLTYQGFYSGKTFKGEEYHANFEIGKYERPQIVYNSNIRYNAKTGEPIGNEKALGGQKLFGLLKFLNQRLSAKS